MKKNLALILSLALLLTVFAGCAAEEKPQQTEAAVADAVVARVYDKEIMLSQLAAQMASVEAMYQSVSGSLSAEQLKERLSAEANNVLNNLISNAVLEYQIDAHNITLTKEEQAEAQSQWDAVLEQMLASIRVNYPTMSEEDQKAMVLLSLQNSSVSQEMVISSAESAILTRKLRAAAAQTMAPVTEDAVNTLYKTLLEEQKTEFDSDPTAFEAAMLGKTVVVYIPRSYRVIQELTIKSSDEVIGLLKQMAQYDNDESTSYEEMLQNEQDLRARLVANLRKRCEEGESFAQACAQTVPGVALKTNYICSDTTRFGEVYYNAAMSIPMEGAVSDTVVPVDYGCTLLCWERSLAPGEIPLDQVRSELTGRLQKEAENAHWQSVQQQWLEEAAVTVFEDVIPY